MALKMQYAKPNAQDADARGWGAGLDYLGQSKKLGVSAGINNIIKMRPMTQVTIVKGIAGQSRGVAGDEQDNHDLGRAKDKALGRRACGPSSQLGNTP